MPTHGEYVYLLPHKKNRLTTSEKTDSQIYGFKENRPNANQKLNAYHKPSNPRVDQSDSSRFM